MVSNNKPKYCGKCGKERKPDKKFCGSCGYMFKTQVVAVTELTQPETVTPRVAATLCGKCGKELKAGKKFCGHCGYNAAAISPKPAIVEPMSVTEPKQPEAAKPVAIERKKRSWLPPAAACITIVIIIAAIVNEDNGSSSNSSNYSANTGGVGQGMMLTDYLAGNTAPQTTAAQTKDKLAGTKWVAYAVVSGFKIEYFEDAGVELSQRPSINFTNDGKFTMVSDGNNGTGTYKLYNNGNLDLIGKDGKTIEAILYDDEIELELSNEDSYFLMYFEKISG